ncbi:MAG: hypothetical protein WC684_08180, partial [Hyphomicrobium sp.]
MLPTRVTLQLLAFLVLAGGVVANVFFMQSSGRGPASAAVSASEAWNIAAIEAAEFGDTGSINHGAKVPAAALKGLDLATLGAGSAPT